MRACGSEGEKSASAIPIEIHVYQGVLGLGGHRLQSLGTFCNGVKKLEHFECELLFSHFDTF